MNQYFNQRGEPRVVITGMGAVTPIGLSISESWENLLAGNSGVGRVTQFDASGMSSQIGGEVSNFNPKDYMKHKEARRMARSSQLAVASARQAVADAGIDQLDLDRERLGVAIGTAIGGLDVAVEGVYANWKGGWTKAKPFTVVAALPNMVSHHVSMLVKSLGPISTITAACATGTKTIGEALELIRRGRADVMLAGGVEGLIHESSYAGFCALRAVATSYNDDPTRASRPFDKNREGFVLGEGSATVVLERLDHALARGAHIHAEVLGHANGSEVYHMATPDPTGRARARVMGWALEDAQVDRDEIDYISAHGTSTPLNDSAETLAVKLLFGEQAYQIPMSSVKALTGHTLGGAGAIEAVLAVKTLQTGILPPTWNYETPDPECDLDYIPNEPREKDVTHILSNSFGLGGQNACLVLKKYLN